MQMEIGVSCVDGDILSAGATWCDGVDCCDEDALVIVVVDVFIVWSFLKLLTDVADDYLNEQILEFII